jgi:HAD superfamily hydrolase (TIGR01509 family)
LNPAIEVSEFFSAVLFDMDGTLVDTEPMWLASETELMARYDYMWTREDQAHCLGGPLDRVGRYMFDLAGGVESPEFFTDMLIALTERHLRDGAHLMEGAEELMALCEELSLPMALVSASPRVLVDAVLGNLEGHNFAISVSSDDVTRAKPDPEGYLAAARFLEVAIEDCLILEDSATGVAAASASGGLVVAIPHLVPISDAERVRIVSSVSQLTLGKLQDLYLEFNS